MNSMPSDEPNQIETAPGQKCTFLEYVEKNPVAAVIQALAIGFAVGMVVRLLEGSREKEPEINVKRKPTLDEAKFHLGSLLLPFLWPAWLKAQEGYGKSAESVRDVVKKAKKGKFTKEGQERLKEVEEWAEGLAELGKKKAKEVEKWVGKEAEHLTEAGKKKVEEWVEKEILPAAECGWKKLRKYFG
jgi:flagellar motility protein MotE (MotC chaperone)